MVRGRKPGDIGEGKKTFVVGRLVLGHGPVNNSNNSNVNHSVFITKKVMNYKLYTCVIVHIINKSRGRAIFSMWLA